MSETNFKLKPLIMSGFSLADFKNSLRYSVIYLIQNDMIQLQQIYKSL